MTSTFRTIGASPIRGNHSPTGAVPLPGSPVGTGTRPRISATVLTKDSARRLADVLNALGWCDEVVLLDTGSTDNTIEIASRYTNVNIHALDEPFRGFGLAHRKAVGLARNDWILSVDSDEIVTDELAAEVCGLELSQHTVYALPFLNYFNGRLIFSCGWHPDRHERLFNRQMTNFCASEVHERVQSKHLTVHNLDHAIRHYSYESADDFLRKMRTYGRLFATKYAGRKSSSPGKAVRRSIWAFVKSYVLQRGFLQGYEGLIISIYKAESTLWKYLLLHEANRRI